MSQCDFRKGSKHSEYEIWEAGKLILTPPTGKGRFISIGDETFSCLERHYTILDLVLVLMAITLLFKKLTS